MFKRTRANRAGDMCAVSFVVFIAFIIGKICEVNRA